MWDDRDQRIFSFLKFSAFPAVPVFDIFLLWTDSTMKVGVLLSFSSLERSHLYMWEVSSPLSAGGGCAAHPCLLRCCSTLSFSGQFRIDRDQKQVWMTVKSRIVQKEVSVWIRNMCASFIYQIDFFWSYVFEVCEIAIRVKKRYKFDTIGQFLCPQKVLTKRPLVCLGCWCSWFCFKIKK